MNLIVQLLQLWKHTTKKLYLHCSTQHLYQPLQRLQLIKKIINCNIQVESNFSNQISTNNDIYIIPTIEINCEPRILIKQNIIYNNVMYKGTFLILQNNWIDPAKSSIEFSDTIYILTTDICNIFLTYFFNNIQSNNINIFFNINDKFTQEIIQLFSQFKIMYHNQLVKINCYPQLPTNLIFHENDFLINRLQDFNINSTQQYIIKKINAQTLGANNANINYVEIIESINNLHCSYSNIRYIVYALRLFTDILINLDEQ